MERGASSQAQDVRSLANALRQRADEQAAISQQLRQETAALQADARAHEQVFSRSVLPRDGALACVKRADPIVLLLVCVKKTRVPLSDCKVR